MLVVMLGLALAGCANELSIYRDRDQAVSGVRVITEDAKQRGIYIVPYTETSYTYDDKGHAVGAATQRLRLCAEPPPDAFSAYSASASGELGLSALETDPNIQAKAALALAESAGTIERTQTINLLRESMYRTCERYLNNATTKEQMIVQAARDQRTMLSVLAIEQLTRTVRPPATLLMAGGTTASLQNSAEMADALGKAIGAQQDSQTAYDAATKVIADKECGDITKSAQPSADPDKTKWSDCKKLESDRDDKKSDLAKKTALVDDLKNTLIGNAAASTTAGSSSTGGAGTTVATASDLAAVAQAVTTIATTNSGLDEMQMMCVAMLQDSRLLDQAIGAAEEGKRKSLAQKRDDLVSSCLEFMKNSAKLDSSRMEQLLAVQTTNISPSYTVQRGDDLQKLKAYLAGQAKPLDAWKALVSRPELAPLGLDIYAKVGDINEALVRFSSLPASLRSAILTAAATK